MLAPLNRDKVLNTPHQKTIDKIFHYHLCSTIHVCTLHKVKNFIGRYWLWVDFVDYIYKSLPC